MYHEHMIMKRGEVHEHLLMKGGSGASHEHVFMKGGVGGSCIYVHEGSAMQRLDEDEDDDGDDAMQRLYEDVAGGE